MFLVAEVVEQAHLVAKCGLGVPAAEMNALCPGLDQLRLCPQRDHVGRRSQRHHERVSAFGGDRADQGVVSTTARGRRLSTALVLGRLEAQLGDGGGDEAGAFGRAGAGA